MDIRKFQLDSNYNILSCKVASKIKIQMLQFNGTLFRGIDETGPEIIIRDKKIRKKKKCCPYKPTTTIISNY